MATKNHAIAFTQVYRLLLFCSMASIMLALMPASANAQGPLKTKADFCSQLGKTIQASSGAQMYCFGPQTRAPKHKFLPTLVNPKALANVNAANPAEDRTGSGVYIGGQSETSIAASGNFVVEAWNDGTGFFNPCGAPLFSEELTGYGFSSNGGKTFTDLGGLPNNNCFASRWSGDPSVGVYTNSGFTYFYISSLFSTPSGLTVAVSACQVIGNFLSCGQPTIVATSACNGCGFSSLDKDYLVIDQARKRLYITYTDFNTVPFAAGQIEMAACDLDSPLAPSCQNGTSNAQPYVIVQPGDSINFCENEGSYPALDQRTGDVYVAFESNWYTNVFGSFNCVSNIPTQVVVVRVPASCLPDPDTGQVSPCNPPFLENANNIISMDIDNVPGYNRGFNNDFPRIAVSDKFGTVSLVWNDARNKPFGDILLQSYNLGTLTAIQSSPVQLNNDNGAGDVHTMPGLKNASGSGLLNITWYDRRGTDAGTGKTDIFGAVNVSPRTSRTPANRKFTNASTDWLATSSVIVPNFGDYTDNFVSSSNILYVTWSDGRTGVPQPEVAHTPIQ